MTVTVTGQGIAPHPQILLSIIAGDHKLTQRGMMARQSIMPHQLDIWDLAPYMDIHKYHRYLKGKLSLSNSV